MSDLPPDNSETASAQPDAEVQIATVRSPAWLRTIIVLSTVLLVMGPLGVHEFPKEVGRWHFAAAQEHSLTGDFNAAIDKLNQAMEWEPDSVAYFLKRAEWNRERAAYQEALEDCNRALELERSAEVFLERSTVYQHLQQHDLAVADWKEIQRLVKDLPIDEESPQQGLARGHVLNGLAYARGIGRIELAQALRDIKLAIEEDGSNAAYLDTRGYIHYALGQLDEAERDMQKAVELSEQDHNRLKASLEEVRGQTLDPRMIDQFVDRSKRTLAVLYYHRALVLEQLAKPQEAEADRKKVKELGFEPNDELF